MSLLPPVNQTDDQLIKQFVLNPIQSVLVKNLRYLGYHCWVTGGAIRDILIGRVPKDLDIAHNAPVQYLTELCESMGYKIADLNALAYGIVRIGDKENKSLVDFTVLYRQIFNDGRHPPIETTDSIEEYLSKRDFTINAMAAEIDEEGKCGPIIDPFVGTWSAEHKFISIVNGDEDRIKEDFIRILRACRFTALSEDWHLDTGSFTICKKYAIDVMRCSKERIRDEIIKGLMYPKPSNMFRTMQEIGLLQYVFPDLARGVGEKQNVHHNYDSVFEHLLRCLDASVSLTDNPMLRLAALTHDIAKPHTKKMIDGDATFHKHEVVGSHIMRDWMRAFKFPKKDIEYVTKMVLGHQWRFTDDTTDKTIRHWLRETGRTEWRDLITLRMADRMGNAGKQDKPVITQKMRELVDRVEKMINAGVPLFKEDLAISGKDLIEMGLKPSPLFNQIFREALGIVVTSPEKNTKEWLTNFVQRNYISKTEVPPNGKENSTEEEKEEEHS